VRLLCFGLGAVALLLGGCGGADHRPGPGTNETGTGGTGGGPGGSVTGDAGGNACVGLALPECPAACAATAFPDECGQTCDEEGAACGNDLGDGMRCIEGTWQCFVHAPLGPGCNLVCRRSEG